VPVADSATPLRDALDREVRLLWGLRRAELLELLARDDPFEWLFVLAREGLFVLAREEREVAGLDRPDLFVVLVLPDLAWAMLAPPPLSDSFDRAPLPTQPPGNRRR
jgi:hypothetical protein